MKKVLLVLVIILVLFSCGKNENKLTDADLKKISENELKWNNDITKLVPYLEESYQIPEKSEYETKAEYEKKIDSITNSINYKKMQTDTFAIVFKNLSIETGYDAETNFIFFLPKLGYYGLEVHSESGDGETYQGSNAFGTDVTVIEKYHLNYIFRVKNRFFKDAKSNKLLNIYSFKCTADLAQKREKFRYKVFFTLSDFIIEKEKYYEKATISSPREEIFLTYILNTNIHKIDVMIDNDIIFTFTKENQKEVNSELLPKMTSYY
ncbi:MAG: hypothetical protein H6Q15_174 [Bacteroidetes bacterium]|nr:hypothetical protein [Bacteroidota bacterium]